MQRLRPTSYTLGVGTAMLAAASMMIIVVPSRASAQAERGSTIFAQQLVDSARARHPEADEIGIMTTTRRGCVGIASTDKSDVGEKCEADDVQPMKTGKPSVSRDGKSFDVSVLLHDETGRAIGVLGVGFKPTAGLTEASATAAAQKIAAEMAARIPAKAKLFTRPK